jgi:hypothetical protein
LIGNTFVESSPKNRKLVEKNPKIRIVSKCDEIFPIQIFFPQKIVKFSFVAYCSFLVSGNLNFVKIHHEKKNHWF